MKKTHLLLVALTLCFQYSFGQEDPYLWLEEIESEKSMEWVHSQNDKTKRAVESSPGFATLKDNFLKSMNDDEKIDYPTVVKDMVYNFWKDENHVRGIWRRTSKKLYMKNESNWGNSY